MFTNCRELEALEALEALHLPPSLFAGIFGADFMGSHCKPELAAFEKVIAASGCEPQRTAFFEDSFRNLVTARALGMRTILVGSTTLSEEGPAAALIEATLSARVPTLTLEHLRSSPAAAFLPIS